MQQTLPGALAATGVVSPPKACELCTSTYTYAYTYTHANAYTYAYTYTHI